MADSKYYYETGETGISFLTDKMKSNFCIESIWVDGINGFDLFLVDEVLNIEIYFLTVGITNFDLNINITEGQRIKVVSKGNTMLEKILIQGKTY